MNRPSRVGLQIPAEVGDSHRVTRERHRDAGADLEPRRVFGGQQQRQEGVVVDLARPAAVVALPFELARPAGNAARSLGMPRSIFSRGGQQSCRRPTLVVAPCGDATVSNSVWSTPVRRHACARRFEN